MRSTCYIIALRKFKNGQTCLEEHSREGETPVRTEAERGQASTKLVRSQVAWECSLKRGGILHLRLNNDERPIANKYREGKMKRTLKREFKELEVVEMEGIWSTMLLLRIICSWHYKCHLWTSLTLKYIGDD